MEKKEFKDLRIYPTDTPEEFLHKAFGRASAMIEREREMLPQLAKKCIAERLNLPDSSADANFLTEVTRRTKSSSSADTPRNRAFLTLQMVAMEFDPIHKDKAFANALGLPVMSYFAPYALLNHLDNYPEEPIHPDFKMFRNQEFMVAYAKFLNRYSAMLGSFFWFIAAVISDKNKILNWETDFAKEVFAMIDEEKIINQLDAARQGEAQATAAAHFFIELMHDIHNTLAKNYPNTLPPLYTKEWSDLAKLDENLTDAYDPEEETYFSFEREPHLSRVWSSFSACQVAFNVMPGFAVSKRLQMIPGMQDMADDKTIAYWDFMIDFASCGLRKQEKEDIADAMVGITLDQSLLIGNAAGSYSRVKGSDFGITTLKDAFANRQLCIPWATVIEFDVHPFAAVCLFELPSKKVVAIWLTSSGKAVVLHSLLENEGVLASNQFAFVPAIDNACFDVDWDEEAYLYLKGFDFGYGQLLADLSVITAGLVRDFWTCEYRYRVLGAPREGRLRGRVGELLGDIHIYLPRMKYIGSVQAAQRLNTQFDYDNRASHMVMAYNRLLPQGHKPSLEQLEIARAQNRVVPPGFTFVKSHERGTEAEIKRRRIYHSKSATLELAKIRKRDFGNVISEQMCPLAFEEVCSQFMKNKELIVTHHNVSFTKDRGIDIHTFKVVDGKPYRILAQCKRYKHSVGAPAVKEFFGAYELERRLGKDKEIAEAWMFALYGFSSDAVEAARELGIRLITGFELQGGVLH